MSPTPLETASKLAIERIIPTAVTEQIAGTPEPEQLERRPIQMKLVDITPTGRLTQPAGVTIPEPITPPAAPPTPPPITPTELPPEIKQPLPVEPLTITDEKILDMPFTVRDPYTGKDINLTLKQGIFVWRGDKLEGFYNREGNFIATRPSEVSLWEKTGAFFSQLWRSLPVNPYYWKSPVAKWEADRKEALIAWAKEADLEDPEKYVEDFLTREITEPREFAYEAIEPDERRLRLPPIPTRPIGEDVTVGERFIGEWAIPLAILSALPSAGAVRTELAGVTGAARIPAEVARVGLAPLAGAEWATGKLLNWIAIKPLKFGYSKTFGKLSTAKVQKAWLASDYYKTMPEWARGTSVERGFKDAWKLSRGTAEKQAISRNLLSRLQADITSGEVFKGDPALRDKMFAFRAKAPTVKPPITPPTVPSVKPPVTPTPTIPTALKRPYDLLASYGERGVANIKQFSLSQLQAFRKLKNLGLVETWRKEGLTWYKVKPEIPPIAPTAKMPPTVPPKVPPVIPTMPSVKPPVVDKVNQFIKALKPARALTKKLRHEELAKRVGQFAETLKVGTGREAFLSAKAALRGKLPIAEFALPEEVMLTPQDVVDAHNLIRDSKFRPLTKLRISNSLDALLTEGKLPTEGEIPLLQEIFGEEFVQGFIDIRSMGAKAVDLFAEIINMPRAFLTPVDWSFLYRQGAIPMLGEPEKYTLGAFKASVKGTFSKKMATDMKDAIKANKYWPKLLEAKVEIMPLPWEAALPSWRAEPWVSHLAEKIPILGKFIERSEMAYVSAANKIRSDMFYRYAAESEGMGYPVEWDRAMGDYINTSTGRGSLGAWNRAMPILNMGLFSTRLQAARITLPIKIFTWAPPVRRLAIRQVVRAVLTVTSLITAAKTAFPDKVEIETDPRSTDSIYFGKVKIGDTRIDLGAGFGQYLRLMTQLIVAERKLTTGEIIESDRLQTSERFVRSKLSPIASLVIDLFAGQTFIGEEMTLETEDVQKQVYNRFTPLFIQDMIDALERDGMTGGYSALPGWFGFGIVTYPPYGLAKWEESIKDKMGDEFLKTNRPQLQADYAEAEDLWAEYVQLPKGKARASYRFDNPEIEASLFFWGEVAQITNPASWEYVNELVSKYQLPEEALPIREEEPWEPERKTPEEMFGDLLNMYPKYISDYAWENKEEWQAKDLPTLIPKVEAMRLADRALIDRYNKITLGEESKFRKAYRRDHPDIDAALNFWGKVSTAQTNEARDLIAGKADELGIPYEIIPALKARPRRRRVDIKLVE